MVIETLSHGSEGRFFALVVREPATEKGWHGRRRFVLSDWLPSALRARGREVRRDDERAYRDLQVALGASAENLAGR